MPFRKKTPKVDIHIWIEEGHLATLDQISRDYGTSRGGAIAALLEDYERSKGENHEPVSRNAD